VKNSMDVKYRRIILAAIKKNGSYQVRYFTRTSTKGVTSIHNKIKFDLLQQLSRERRLHIIGRRCFGTTFDDSSSITGINLTAVAYE